MLLGMWWYLNYEALDMKKLRDSGPFWLVTSTLTTEKYCCICGQV